MKVISSIVVVILLLAALPMHAQWNIGGIICNNLASINVDPDPSTEAYSSRLGFGLGVVVDRSLFGQFDLHTGLLFLQKGGKIKEFGEKIIFNIVYLELPIMFRYTFQTSTSLRPYVMAGPSIGILLSGKYKWNDGWKQDAKDELKSLDLGVGFGGGVSMPIKFLTVFAEARYVLGFININDDPGPGESKVRNRGLLVVVGATIPIGK